MIRKIIPPQRDPAISGKKSRLHRLKALLLVSLCFCVLVSFLSGCGSRYSAERLYWQAGQAAKKITQDKSLDNLIPEDYQNIIAAYRRVVDKHPLEPLAAQSQFIIARLYVLQGEYSKAKKELVRVTQNFSRNSNIASRAQFTIGTLYKLQGDWETAVSEYEKIVDLYPLSRLGLRTPIYIAQQYQRNQKESQAEKAYNKAIRGYEGIIEEYSGTSVVPNVMEYLALAYLNQGKWNKAIEVWQKITDEYSHSPIAAKSLLATGETSRQIKDLEKAIQSYEDFVEQFPQSKVIKQVRFQIGRLYFDKGETEKAKQAFLEILGDYPQEADLCANARFALATYYEKEGDSASALEEYQKISQDYPQTNVALGVPFFIAKHYFIIKKDREKAEAAFTQAIEKYQEIIEGKSDDQQIIEAGRLLSLCFVYLKRWDEAVDSLYNFAVKYPANPSAQMFLLNTASIYQSELGQSEKAIRIYEEMIDKYPASRLADFAKRRLAQIKEQE